MMKLGVDIFTIRSQGWNAFEYLDYCKKIGLDLVHFTLEIITGMAPRVLPYLEADFWDIFPQAHAAEFARFEKLVREGTAFTGNMLTAPWHDALPDEYQAALVVQQRLDLERSLAHCRETFF